MPKNLTTFLILLLFAIPFSKACAEEAANREITVMVSSQDDQGMSASGKGLDEAWLKNYSAYLLETLKAKILKNNPDQPELAEAYISKFSTNYTLYKQGSGNLGIVRSSNSLDRTQSVQILGLRTGEIKRITCVGEGQDEPISILRGTCADKIREIFGDLN